MSPPELWVQLELASSFLAQQRPEWCWSINGSPGASSSPWLSPGCCGQGTAPGPPGRCWAGWAAVTLWGSGWWARPGCRDFYFTVLNLFLVNFLRAALRLRSPVKGHGFLFVLACLQWGRFRSHCSDPARPACPHPFLRRAATCRQRLPSIFLWCRAHKHN